MRVDNFNTQNVDHVEQQLVNWFLLHSIDFIPLLFWKVTHAHWKNNEVNG